MARYLADVLQQGVQQLADIIPLEAAVTGVAASGAVHLALLQKLWRMRMDRRFRAWTD